jgi:trk system potassium uptake protein TrkH
VGRQVRRALYGGTAVHPVAVDHEMIEVSEVRRIASLFFAWMVLLLLGGSITALLSDWGPLEAASGMFSALGNIGPCYIPATQMSHLHPIVKLTYIVGMLAGRLEILPVLLLFGRRTWR